MKKDINWQDVQDYYNNNHTWKDIMIEFKLSSSTIANAKNKGLLTFRTKSEASSLSFKKSKRILSDETKKKISASMTKFMKENPDRVPYKLNHSSNGQSYPEAYFDKIFNGSFMYVKYHQISLYHIDFAILEKKIAIEIDGDQHYLDKKIIESDKRKNKLLLDDGWDIIRIKWSDYKKMDFLDKEIFIENLIDYINKLSEIKPTIEVKERLQKGKNYCECDNIKWKTSKFCIKCHNKNRNKNTEIEVM